MQVLVVFRLTHLRMFLQSKFQHFRVLMWNSAQADARGVNVNLHFPVPSLNRLYQTEPTTFSTLPCWAIFLDSRFLCFTNV
jgi:hypothetical protein